MGLYQKLNNVNLQISGKLVTLIEAKHIILNYIDKLDLIRQNILRGELYQFLDRKVEIKHYGDDLRKDTNIRFQYLIRKWKFEW